ncbi:MAG: flagellar export chaperone FliS [Burkholderiaceae bacterium]
MRVNFKAMESYGVDNLASQASVASNTALIQMLFDGLVDSLVEAQGHLKYGAIQEKGKSMVRASRIVLGLQGALDFQKGGELAQNLDELYNYVTRRLIFANAYNDLSVLEELQGLMTELRDAWRDVPALIQSKGVSRVH